MRIRADGWTPLKQAEFIGHLAETRSVAKAARAVGMARETAYRLRERAGSASFCAAWQVALDATSPDCSKALVRTTRKVTLFELQWRLATGIWHVILRRGKYAGVRCKPDNSAMFALLSRTEAAAARFTRGAAE